MHKGDLVEAIAKKTGQTKASAKRMLEAMLEVMKKSLKKGENVTLIGFGTFKVTKRKARTGRNPQTGKAIKIPAKKVVKFVPGKKLKNDVK